MNKINKLVFREINRISPSQFYSMKNCTYKSILAEAFEKKPLLPVSPNAYFGTVLHKMLEQIAKGAIKDEESFNRSFDDQVRLQEENLKQLHYDFFTPLQKNVKDFGMKKVLLKKHLRHSSEKKSKVIGVKYHSEKWFESKDKLIGGKVDLVIEDETETEIIDFKTGAITQDFLDEEGEVFSEIKAEYKEQLKLYGHLYFETTGKYPTQLSLVDLAKQKFTVDFTPSECNDLFNEAKALLKITNENVSKGIFAANPSEANCKFCLYRPACSFFLKQLETDYSFNDVSGIIKNVVKYQNGNSSVFLENKERKITVTSFPSEKYTELNESRGKQITLFNLRKEATEFVYSATKTTIIYE
ncbi:PD-(D/E)XK nuclease family protein [Chitinophaga sp. LS1]|uniref:PD-(D/E)XK nuclease family protein n=1 Tax=Chitinophaga sp. LS1 TaxID=3051176 RepID=UPI002AABDF12|nr:PD-(D/E)XK nuclease family protein [Chitinophaga sp. LS1]WPV65413.1 PD-(D/E)XK nuclease family protein [Chitinophaga sp. LS1]